MAVVSGAPYVVPSRGEHLNSATVGTLGALFALAGCVVAVLTALPLPFALLAVTVPAIAVLATWRATRRLEKILREETAPPR